MTLRPDDPIAAEIHDLKLAVDIGRAVAQGIEDRRAKRRPFDRAPRAYYSPEEIKRHRRRDYDATKRAKAERARVGVMLARIAELERQQRRLDALAAEL